MWTFHFTERTVITSRSSVHCHSQQWQTYGLMRLGGCVFCLSFYSFDCYLGTPWSTPIIYELQSSSSRSSRTAGTTDHVNYTLGLGCGPADQFASHDVITTADACSPSRYGALLHDSSFGLCSGEYVKLPNKVSGTIVFTRLLQFSRQNHRYHFIEGKTTLGRVLVGLPCLLDLFVYTELFYEYLRKNLNYVDLKSHISKTTSYKSFVMLKPIM